MGQRVALVACASKKISFATSAEALYSSDLFKKASRLAALKFDKWYVLSAKHGVLRPDDLIDPYDETLNRMSHSDRVRWADRVLHSLQDLLQAGDSVFFFAGARYREFLIEHLAARGIETHVPTAGLSIGRQLQWLNVQLNESQRLLDIERLYHSLRRLTEHPGRVCLLGEATGRLTWPNKGLYFFFEPDERRTFDPRTSRIVRIGTHGVSRGSKSTLWGRLRTHRGGGDGGGNHRGSIFRLHIGAALQAAEKIRTIATWGIGQTAVAAIRESERDIEREVSAYLARMAFICLGVGDEPGATSDRAYLERNLIGLLCGPTGPVDLPSERWLGRFSRSDTIRHSGLWNIDHVFFQYDTRALDILNDYVDISLGNRQPPIASLAPVGWANQPKETKPATQLSLLSEDASVGQQ